jgi:hypothetical protein
MHFAKDPETIILRTHFVLDLFARSNVVKKSTSAENLRECHNYKIRGSIKHGQNVEQRNNNLTSLNNKRIRSGICVIRCNPSPSRYTQYETQKVAPEMDDHKNKKIKNVRSQKANGYLRFVRRV